MFFKQGHILKRFKDTEIFFETIGLNKSTIYVKINIHRLVKKYPRLRNLTLSSNYLKNNFKKIKFVCEKVVMNLWCNFLSFFLRQNFLPLRESSPTETIFFN